MKATLPPRSERTPAKPICIGLTCWLWELGRSRQIMKLGEKTGVKVELTERIRGLHREIECRVTGKNVDQFIGDFVRHC